MGDNNFSHSSHQASLHDPALQQLRTTTTVTSLTAKADTPVIKETTAKTLITFCIHHNKRGGIDEYKYINSYTSRIRYAIV